MTESSMLLLRLMLVCWSRLSYIFSQYIGR